ncbi:MAG: Retroviral aspartyl protease [Bacteriophage sp.]|jgi:hypothetical protein|nr:MAG: Retroviral aspartyl protease [Bacteriophage sp.]
MRRIALLIIMLFLAVGCNNKPVNTESLLYFENKYTEACNIPVVKSQVGNQTAYFIIDTGANTSLIDSDYYRTHQELFVFSHTVDVQYHGIGGSTEEMTVDVVIGELSIGDVIFMESDLSSVRRQLQIEGYNIIGIIGSDFFERTLSIIDYGNRALYFASLDLDSLNIGNK